MLVLNSSNNSDWYYFEDPDTQKRFIFESFTNTRSREVSQRKTIQGFPGTLIMDIDGASWTSNFSSDAIILQSELYYDIFDLLINDFNNIKQFLAYQNRILTDKNLLSNATINLGNTVNINLDYNQKFDNIFNFKNVIPNTEENDFTGRVAKFYDTSFYLAKKDGTDELLEFKIHSGSITITIDYDKLYFVNSDSEFPFYSPQNYKISGSVKTYTTYENLGSLISDPRTFNALVPTRANSSIAIGTRYLELGQVNIQSDLKYQKQNGLLEVDFSFVSYARYYEEQ
jgi:hypothetical protein